MYRATMEWAERKAFPYALEIARDGILPWGMENKVESTDVWVSKLWSNFEHSLRRPSTSGGRPRGRSRDQRQS